MAAARSRKALDSTAAVRRRISRACDQCNQLRTKCDGKDPCAHCVEFGLVCENRRERKKRGKASRKDIARQQAIRAPGGAEEAGADPDFGLQNGPISPSVQSDLDAARGLPSDARSTTYSEISAPYFPNSHNRSHIIPYNSDSLVSSSLSVSGGPSESRLLGARTTQGSEPHYPRPWESQPYLTDPPSHCLLPDSDESNARQSARSPFERGGEYAARQRLSITTEGHHLSYGSNMVGHSPGLSGVPNETRDRLLSIPTPPATQIMNSDSRTIGQRASSMAGSPMWLPLPSPSAMLYPQLYPSSSLSTLRYPVLQPVLPYLESIIPTSLACDLLEIYFQTTSWTFLQPLSPYVLGFVFRKNSFLRQRNPRGCSPALLASMLLIGAQTSDSAFLTSPPSTRGKTCQKLWDLTVALLRPLVHSSTVQDQGLQNYGTMSSIALGGLGFSHPASPGSESGCSGAAASLDDVATYMHLATISSASEYKASSLRWWNAAWSLARELRLCRELPTEPVPPSEEMSNSEYPSGAFSNDFGLDNDRQGGSASAVGSGQCGTTAEEEREERRRIWWLLYTMDRHLALCYNGTLHLLDVECDQLLQPLDEAVWQAGEYLTTDLDSYPRGRGPPIECTGHGIFGYFLPLMTILGEIVELNQARNHPRFGTRFRTTGEWDEQTAAITGHLEKYAKSLQDLESYLNSTPENQTTQPENQPGFAQFGIRSPMDSQRSNSISRDNQATLQVKTVIAYGTHLMHTLHILINGKWDPISLLDDNDLWISSPSFLTATGHAVSAADALNDILEYDPDLSFMPFFFGIYLLQGSFLLLLIADKLQAEVSHSVVKACETIVRAHEACVATLNTEYQRNFRKVMRSALAQVKGRLLQDDVEQQLRRREVLALYRWTGDGTGLAL